MNYVHVLSEYASVPLAMEPTKIDAITAMLLSQARGDKLSDAEIEARIGKREENAVQKSEGSIAILPVYGSLSHRVSLLSRSSGGTSYESLAQDFRALMADDQVSAVIMDFDSPGGVTLGLQELADEIRGARGIKPIIAQVTGRAASAAYWLATQADEVIITPSGEVGSIGVYTSHDDVSAALEKAGIKRTFISAGKYKVEGNPTEPLAEDARAYIQERVNSAYGDFVSAVAIGRGVTEKTVSERFGQGRMFDAAEAVKRGMADAVATLDQTLERFGASRRPQVMRDHAAEKTKQAAALDTLRDRLKAGETPQLRELEHGLKGAFGLSNSEAERAARVLTQANPGEPEQEAEALAAAIANLQASLDAFGTSNDS